MSLWERMPMPRCIAVDGTRSRSGRKVMSGGSNWREARYFSRRIFPALVPNSAASLGDETPTLMSQSMMKRSSSRSGVRSRLPEISALAMPLCSSGAHSTQIAPPPLFLLAERLACIAWGVEIGDQQFAWRGFAVAELLEGTLTGP